MTPSIVSSRRKSVALVASLVLTLTFAVLAGGRIAPASAQEPAPNVPLDKSSYLPVVVGVPPAPVGMVIPGQYIVVLKPPELRAASSPDGVAPSAAQVAEQVVAAYGGELLYTYDSALSGFAARLPEVAAADLILNPNVAIIEEDTIVSIAATQSPATWGLDRIDQRALPLSNSYAYVPNGLGVHAYVMDTGIRSTHTEFAGRMGGGYTAIVDEYGTNDCHGHGTHVAGTIGGTTYGVAKKVTLHSVRVLGCNGSGATSAVIAGIDWITANRVLPAVANMSLIGGISTAMEAAITNSMSAGVTYVVAAGNANVNACGYSPARLPALITVSATTNADARTSYANFGSCLDLFAPGQSITSASHTSDSATTSMSGTSMAAPHVAGAAALYLSVYPNIVPATVRSSLVQNATSGALSAIGTGSPNLLLYTGYMVNPSATATPTRTPTKTPTPSGATSTPTATPTRTPTPAPTSTPVPGCTQRVTNGGFESGATTWAQNSAGGFALICNTTSCGSGTTTARTGSWLSWLGGANDETASLRQTITVPSGADANFGFYYWLDSSDYCGYDFGYARIIVNGVTTTLRTFDLCATANTGGWQKQNFDLSAYAGQSVTLSFEIESDSTYASDFFIDDASVVSGNMCVAGDPGDADPPVDPTPAPREFKLDLPAAPEELRVP